MKTIRVVAAVIRAKDKIFATARGYGEFKGGWEFPGGKIEEGETPQEALVREIKEELEAEIEVGQLIDTIEYDYPNFHLSMDCFWAEIKSGQLVLKEAEAAKWLSREELDFVEWLPADITLIDKIAAQLQLEEDTKKDETTYAMQWTETAKQHFDDGDYEWVCDIASRKNGSGVIFELGCGTGHSTFAFVIKDFKVISIDCNGEAIKSAQSLLEEYDYNVGDIYDTDSDVILWKVDLVHETPVIANYIKGLENKPDYLVLCNPGGCLINGITQREYDMLRKFGFSEEEIRTTNINRLHTWAIKYAALALSAGTDIPLLLIDRGEDENDVDENMRLLCSDTGCRILGGIQHRIIRNSPKGGMKINTEGEKLTWGAAVITAD